MATPEPEPVDPGMPPEGGAPVDTGMMGAGEDVGGGLAGYGNTDDLSNNDLAAMAGIDPEQAQEEDAIAQMQAILDDPATPPQDKAVIQQQLELAARQRLDGLGGM